MKVAQPSPKTDTIIQLSANESSPINSSAGNTPNTKDSTKIIHCRGNTYTMKDTKETEAVVNTMMNSLYAEALSLSSTASTRAMIFKYIYIIANVFIIIAGTVIGVLTSQNTVSSTDKTVVTVLGFIITGVGSILTTFSLEKRGVLLESISNDLKRISREVKELQCSDLDINEKMSQLESLYIQVDSMDLTIYDNKTTTLPTNIENTKSSL